MISAKTAPAVSVIVPVYNVERYLDKCLTSLLQQTFSDFEILLVDDGSKDSSPELCDAWSLRYPQQIRTFHKENGGASTARNYGIDRACGEYLCFIDADDAVYLNFLERLYQGATCNDCDIAACKNMRIPEGDSLPVLDGDYEDFVCTGYEALSFALLGTKVSGSMCDKMIRRDALGDLRFPEGIIYEDAFLSSVLYPAIERVFVTTEPLYCYTYRVGSATASSFNLRHLDAIDVYSKIYDWADNDCPQLIPQARFRLTWAYFEVLDKMLLCERYKDIPQYPAVLSYLRSRTKEVISDPYFRTARKIGALILSVSVRGYRMLVLKRERDNRKG